MDTLNNQDPVQNGSQMPISSAQQTTPMPPMQDEPEEHKASAGPIAGAAIVIILLIAGGLYFWGSQLQKDVMTNTAPYIPSDDAAMQGDPMVGLPPQSSSDEAASIQADFNAMDLNVIDAENSAEFGNI